MDVEAAVELVAARLGTSKGAALTEDAREELRARLEIGRERALAERDEEAFDAAVEELTQQLTEVVGLVSMVGGEVEAYVTGNSIDMAWRDICPLWPFC